MSPIGVNSAFHGRAALLTRLRAFRGRLPADFKFDREEANAR
jgi:antitoxin MazE